MPRNFTTAVRTAAAALLTAALLILGVINIVHKVTWKEPTDGVTWEESPEGLRAAKVEENSPAYLYSIKPGDILYSITLGNLEYRQDTKTTIDVAKALWMASTANQKVSYQIARPGQILTPAFYLAWKRTNILYFFLSFIGLSALAIAVIVFFNTRHPLHVPYHIFFLSLLCFFTFHVFSPTGEMDILDSLFYWLDKTALLFFPPLLFHFFTIFPRRREIRRIRPTFLLYLPAMTLLLARVFIHLPNFLNLSDGFILRYCRVLDKLDLALFSVYAVMIFLVLLRDALKVSSRMIKKQLTFSLYGLGLGTLPFIVFYGLPFLLADVSSRVAELTIVFNALLPLTLAYSVSRYKMMDLEVMIKKAITLIFSYIVITVLYIVVSSQTKIFSENRLNALILGILAIILGATLFSPLKRLSQSLLDRVIYKKSYRFRKTLLSISQEIGRERNLYKLSESILEMTANALSLKYIAILLPMDNKKATFFILRSRGEAPLTRGQITFDDQILALITRADFISPYTHQANKEHQKGFAELSRSGIFHIMPLNVEDKLIGILGMGKKHDNSFLTSEDCELLRTISSPVALALENAYLYNQASIRTMELERLKDYSENIIESLTVGVAVLDQKGKVIGWNRVLERILGIGKQAVLKKDLVSVLGKKNYSSLFPTDTQKNLRLLSEIAIELPTGNKKIFDISKTSLLDNIGRPYGTIVVFEDITDKLSLQQQLLTSEKLASIGLLSAGVAHEINTPLTGISSYIQILQKKLSDSSTAPILEKIEAQAERVGRIVKNLLNFARNPSESSFHQVNLKQGLEEILALIEYKLKNLNIGLELDLSPVRTIWAQGEKLQQVFINIILNAIDAMPHGGTLSIIIRETERQVVITIKDTGTGIKEQHLGHIFDPFFTTKGIGKGTGLGLSISYAIIKEHEGQISVKSEEGKGTLFTITIPNDLDKRNKAAVLTSTK